MTDLQSANVERTPEGCPGPLGSVLFFFAVVFLAFVPFGSAQFVLPGVKLDNLVGMALSAILAVEIARTGRVPIVDSWLFLATTLFFLTSMFSVLVAPDPSYSINRYIIIFGYAFAATMLPKFMRGSELALLKALGIAGLASAFVLILSYLILGLPSWGRMTIPTYYLPSGRLEYFPEGWGSSPDPNILGVGLVYGGLAWLAASRGTYGKFAIFFTIVGVVLSTGSRTALIALVGGFCVAFWFSLVRRNWARLTLRRSGILMVLMFFGAVALGAFSFGHAISEIWAARLAKDDSARIEIITGLFQSWGTNLQEVLLGKGFHVARTIQDPHNVYLSSLYDVGLIGLLAFLSILLAAFRMAYRVSSPDLRFVVLWVWGVMAVSGMTYWHTKTWWVPILMIGLISSFDGRANRLVPISGELHLRRSVPA